MIENVDNKTLVFDPLAFGWVDHSVFSLMLLLSMLVGVYFGLCARAKNTAKVDYLLGGKKMGIAPVAVSLIARYASESKLYKINYALNSVFQEFKDITKNKFIIVCNKS